MVGGELAILPAGLKSITGVQESVVTGMGAALSMRVVLAMTIAASFAFTLSTAAHAATITVNSLADPGRVGICALRDAITAANTKTARHGCAAGTDSDQIQFSVRGTILLASTLPKVTDRNLTINGPASPGIKIDGGGRVQVMQVALGARLNLTRLGIANGNNLSTGKGGGIDNEGTLTVTNSTFSRNVAYSIGGGIVNGYEKTLTVTNSTFSGNGAGSGGGISNFGTVTITNSTFSGNDREGDNFFTAFGGGIWSNGTLIVTNSTFSGNGADFGGSIENEGTLTVTSSTFSQNVAHSAGGGIANGGTLTVTNSTFSSNGAVFGGGIENEGALTVTNSTFSSNSANFGGSIFNEESASLKSTILASSANSGNCSGTITDAGYNISDDMTCGFAKTGSANNGDGVNLLLSPAGLANNGGPTQTLALVPGRTAIDVIPLAACTDQTGRPITTDQRGFPRPDAGEAVCDIGAYESSF